MRDGRGSQDAVATSDASSPGEVLSIVAVADGHGDARHFRSDRGARFAVETATAVVTDHADRLAAVPFAAVPGLLSSTIVPELVAEWNARVDADLADDPLDEESLAWMERTGDAPVFGYGTTLLVAAVLGERALFLQIGDGDLVAVAGDGRALEPVPGDPETDGRTTASLCLPNAEQYFRAAVHDLVEEPLFAVLATTDGFGNAQADDDWRHGVAADLVRLALRNGPAWLPGMLGDWTAACASSNGSGDDTTVALLLDTAATLSEPAEPVRRPSAARTGLAPLSPSSPGSPQPPQSPTPLSPTALTVPLPRDRPPHPDRLTGPAPTPFTGRVIVTPPGRRPPSPPPSEPAGRPGGGPRLTGLVLAAAGAALAIIAVTAWQFAGGSSGSGGPGGSGSTRTPNSSAGANPATAGSRPAGAGNPATAGAAGSTASVTLACTMPAAVPGGADPTVPDYPADKRGLSVDLQTGQAAFYTPDGKGGWKVDKHEQLCGPLGTPVFHDGKLAFAGDAGLFQYQIDLGSRDPKFACSLTAAGKQTAVACPIAPGGS